MSNQTKQDIKGFLIFAGVVFTGVLIVLGPKIYWLDGGGFVFQ